MNEHDDYPLSEENERLDDGSRHCDHPCACAHHRPRATGAPGGWWAAIAPVLACAVCPACLTIYMRLFATAGIGFALSERQHLVVLLVAIGLSLGINGYRSRRLGRRGPIVWALVASALILAGHLVEVQWLEWIGAATLLAGEILAALTQRTRVALRLSFLGLPRTKPMSR